jgi:hypothetical protein
MTVEQLGEAWRLAQEPVPAVVVGAWGLLGAVIAVFCSDWRAGVEVGVPLVAASVALVFIVGWARQHEPSGGFGDVDGVLVNRTSGRSSGLAAGATWHPQDERAPGGHVKRALAIIERCGSGGR